MNLLPKSFKLYHFQNSFMHWNKSKFSVICHWLKLYSQLLLFSILRKGCWSKYPSAIFRKWTRVKRLKETKWKAVNMVYIIKLVILCIWSLLIHVELFEELVKAISLCVVSYKGQKIRWDLYPFNRCNKNNDKFTNYLTFDKLCARYSHMNYQYHRKSMRLVLFHNVCRCWETYSNLKLTFKLWTQTCLLTIMSAFHQRSLYTAFSNEHQIFNGITGNYQWFYNSI